jgi:hypothetical protein
MPTASAGRPREGQPATRKPRTRNKARTTDRRMSRGQDPIRTAS